MFKYRNMLMIPNVSGEGSWGPFADENGRVQRIFQVIANGGDGTLEGLYESAWGVLSNIVRSASNNAGNIEKEIPFARDMIGIPLSIGRYASGDKGNISTKSLSFKLRKDYPYWLRQLAVKGISLMHQYITQYPAEYASVWYGNSPRVSDYIKGDLDILKEEMRLFTS